MTAPSPPADKTRSGEETKAAIREHALSLGFDAVGVAPAAAGEKASAALRAFLKAGWHGDMDWMATRAAERSSPQALWPGARSVIMVGVNYGTRDDVLAALGQTDRAGISLYARRRDYHDTIKKKLRGLARYVHERYATEVKLFVDTAPVMEKPLAAAAGLGWQGKHTNLVSTDFGSWLFLGALFTGLELPADSRHADRCGSCRACLDVCPTAAFPAPYQLDARRCIAYLTIEHQGHIAEEFRAAMGNRVFGCDDCLAVCPWNRFARESADARLALRGELEAPPLADLLALDDAAFRALFRGTPVKRTGRDRFIRNCLIAAGNSGDGSLLSQIEALLGDASPLVRAMAVWACRRLCGEGEMAALRQRHADRERDAAVLAEWSRVG